MLFRPAMSRSTLNHDHESGFEAVRRETGCVLEINDVVVHIAHCHDDVVKGKEGSKEGSNVLLKW